MAMDGIKRRLKKFVFFSWYKLKIWEISSAISIFQNFVTVGLKFIVTAFTSAGRFYVFCFCVNEFLSQNEYDYKRTPG